MSDQKHIELNGTRLIPRELSVLEVELVLESLLDGEEHPTERATRDRLVPAVAVALSTGLISVGADDRLPDNTKEQVDQLKQLTASDLQTLFLQVEEKNGFLAMEVGALEKLGRALLEEKSELQSGESGQPSSISGNPPQE